MSDETKKKPVTYHTSLGASMRPVRLEREPPKSSTNPLLPTSPSGPIAEQVVEAHHAWPWKFYMIPLQGAASAWPRQPMAEGALYDEGGSLDPFQVFEDRQVVVDFVVWMVARDVGESCATRVGDATSFRLIGPMGPA